jgi:hypothetical protein
MDQTASRARALAYAAACVPMLAICYVLLQMPLQVQDMLTEVLDAAQSRSVWQAFSDHLAGNGYFRPLFYAEVKWVFDLAHGHYQLAYRAFHAASLCVFVVLFVRVLNVRSRTALVLLPLALSIFFGIHTFLGTVKEIYGTSHFLQVAFLALAALNLAESEGGVLVELALVATFVAAALTLESGLLIWVVIAAAWMARAPGVSTRAVVAVSAMFAGYFIIRFGIYQTEMPLLYERSTTVLLERLDPSDLQQRFGDNPLPLYAYNVAASMASVLFSQPRSGLVVIAKEWIAGDVPARTWINLGASLFATGLIAVYAVRRIAEGVWWPRSWADRQIFIFAGVLAANAVISYGYAKDDIMSVAGALYPVAVFGTAAYFLERFRVRPPAWPAAALIAAVFCTGATLWAVRAAGVIHVLHHEAYAQRSDWTRAENVLNEPHNANRYENVRPVMEAMRREAIAAPVMNPRFIPRWADRIFDADY